MKKLFLFLVAALVGVTFSGCLQDNLELNEPQMATGNKDHYVSLEQALINFMPMYNEAAGSTRSSVIPMISGVERLPLKKQTRSTEEVEPYYIVNFANNAGFAVLSADDRLLPVYAFSTSGHLILEDTVSNPTLSYFLNTLLEQEAHNIPKEGNIDNPSAIVNPAYNFTILVKPLLSEQVSLWNQSAPYSDYCPNKWPVGCSALSIAQICSFHGVPKYFQFKENNTTQTIILDWPKLRTAKSTDETSIAIIAKFLAHLGSKDFLNLDYGPTVSTIDTSKFVNITETVKKLGFARCNELNYNVQGAKTLLKDTIPFIVKSVFGTYEKEDGKENGKKIFKGYKNGGHIFVIDGIASKTLIVSGQLDPYTAVTFYYVHCVWGQSDHTNGYFYNPTYQPQLNILPPKIYNEKGDTLPDEWNSHVLLQKYYVITK